MRNFFKDHGAAFAETLKALVQPAQDAVRRRIRELMSAEDAAAEAIGCPLPAPNWYARNLIKLENALSADLAAIEEFTVELMRFQRGGSDGSSLGLPGGYFKTLITSTP
jgi:hypothetical protein